MMYICYKVIQESKDGKRLVNVPSENVEEVVWCRECIWWHDVCGCACMTFHACDHSPDTFYCAWGEKKNETD